MFQTIIFLRKKIKQLKIYPWNNNVLYNHHHYVIIASPSVLQTYQKNKVLNIYNNFLFFCLSPSRLLWFVLKTQWWWLQWSTIYAYIFFNIVPTFITQYLPLKYTIIYNKLIRFDCYAYVFSELAGYWARRLSRREKQA